MFELYVLKEWPIRKVMDALRVNMAQVNFDLGIVHYASDTPYTQARTLGARGLSYRGMDSTYASAIAVARRILQREEALVSQKK